MLPNTNLSQADAVWLVEEYAPRMTYRVDHSTIRNHQRAFNLIKDSDQPIPSCNCHWVSAAKVAQSLYSQYEAEIREIAYPKVKTRGRKKK